MRRTKGLVTIAALVALAAIGGNATRGSGDVALAGSGPEPLVTVTRTTAPQASRATAPPAPATTSTTPTAKAPATVPATTGTTSKAATKSTTKATSAATTWVVTKVVDGDTIWASRGGVTEKVRVIGIDTPETGQCGFTEARNALRGIIGGQRVTLTPGARTDVDRYGRALRYVDVNGVDAGLRLIKQGYAVARYDSRDGYGSHPREGAYVRADAASPKAACADPNAGSTSGGTSGNGLAGTWPQAGDKYPCPQSRPVKGNEGSMIAHEPTDRYYNVTKPEQCFATMADAEAAGFRPAKV
ncbi:thermonuclease family protein [Terrabacter tumescens]|uniref:thermonuclease family protein n=1 Tax=Terrabacter tumescens TaxID=60443 RepID=UPI0009DF011F|nr:thermonuclease family protein [Terrabacter tumescens]